ncbi:MAG: FAD-binding protein [Clostridia bacterium]|nr:FAD-binding protein [Clostridia bacterium]
MKVLVCAKIIKGELNPFDEAALECALRLSDDVTVVSMSPKTAENALRPLTRLGAKVVLISDSKYAGSDTLATAYILSEAIKKIGFDLILCGRQSIDGDTAQVGPMLSQMLNIPVITNAMEAATEGEYIQVRTRTGTEKATLPALITLERSLTLRFASIFSKPKEIVCWSNKDVGCETLKCGLEGSPTRVLETFENEKGKRSCQFIETENLLPLIEKLKQQEPAAITHNKTGKKLKSVWAVGKEVLEKAYEISENVVLIAPADPREIALRAKEEKPDVILWNADSWGRKNAPIAAAILDTGLCADCTALETDGEQLFMYRPAQGGNITAKIKCIRKPQMATVRTKSECAEIIVSAGRGVKDKLNEVEAFAKSIGAELAASRGLVDTNAVSYDKQIGLTGKTVNPKIYIAIGISGAVHHTCAIEDSMAVIAINPDKNARIFQYADYGITAEF